MFAHLHIVYRGSIAQVSFGYDSCRWERIWSNVEQHILGGVADGQKANRD